MHPVFLIKGWNLWREPKRYWYTVLFHSQNFRLWVHHPLVKMGGLLCCSSKEQEVVSLECFSVQKRLMFFSTFKKYIRSWEKADRRWNLEGWPWLGVKMTLSKGLQMEYFEHYEQSHQLNLDHSVICFSSLEVGPREPGAAHDDDDDVFRCLVQ